MQYYIKYAQYFYLLVAILFLIDAFSKFNEKIDSWWISILLAGIGIFMFIFKRNFAKRFEARNKK